MLDFSRKAVLPVSLALSSLVALLAPLSFVQAAMVLAVGVTTPLMVLTLWTPPTLTVAEVLHTANTPRTDR
jgi:hypothetical protein